MSKKDRIFRVLSIVLLMTMLLFSFGCAGQESLSEINSSAISSDEENRKNVFIDFHFAGSFGNWTFV